MISPVQAARTVRQSAVIAHADFRAFYTWRTWLFGWLIRLICQVVFYTMIGLLVADADYTRYIVLGAAVSLCVAETMLAVASTCWDRHLGTMGLLTASPIEPGLHYFGRSLQWPASAAATTSIAVLAIPPFFGITWTWWQVPVLVGVVVLTCLSTYCMTLLVASSALVFAEARNVISTVTTLSVTAICGAMVPVGFWPLPLQWVAQALPVTHGLAAVRAVADGAPAIVVLAALGWMLSTAACWFVLAMVSFRWVFARSRAGDGTLD